MRSDSRIHWASYPALLLAGAFAVGIIFESTATVGVEGWLGSAVVGLGVWLGAAIWDRRRLVTLAPLLGVGALALLAVSTGGARQALYHAPSPRALAPLAAAADTLEEDVALAGIIRDAPTEDDGTWRFTLSVDTVEAFGRTLFVDGHVRVTLHNPLWISTIAYPTLREGDRLWVMGSLSLASGPRNPGAFDYASYLARRGVCCTMYVRGAEHVQVRGSNRGLLLRIVVQGRSYVREQLARTISGDRPRAVLEALLLGDRSAVSRIERDRFASTGLMHLLAVSGLHVLLVGMVLYGLLRPLLMRIRIGWKTLEVVRAAATMCVLGLYMLLTGARPSVVRAVVMAGVLIGGILAQRSSHALNSLGVAGLVLLALRPPALFDAGFQLSMAAVAAIVTLHPRMLDLVPEGWTAQPAGDWLVSTVSVSIAATLGTAPVLLHHFGQVSIAGLVLNVVAIPLTAVGLTAGVLAVATGGAAPVLASAFGASADVFVKLLLETARLGSEWLSWGLLIAPMPDLWVLAAGAAALVAGAQWPRPRVRWGVVALAGALLAGSAWTPVVSGRGEPALHAVFLDVGQGDAALITLPSGQHLLVDAGPRSRYYDAGASVVVPYLRSRGISRIHTAVVTHPDSDHLGGLPAVLRSVDVGRVLHSGRESDTQLYAETRRIMDSLGVQDRAVHAGDTLGIDPSVRVRVLGPPKPVPDHGFPAEPSLREALSENDASVVVQIVYGETRILMTGDIEEKGERWLLAQYGDEVRSDVVKVPHHGSATSSGEQLVRRVTRPDGLTHGVVSVGENNAFGLPDFDVLSRWQRASNHLHLTSRRGAVWMRSDGGRIQQVRWKE